MLVAIVYQANNESEAQKLSTKAKHSNGPERAFSQVRVMPLKVGVRAEHFIVHVFSRDTQSE